MMGADRLGTCTEESGTAASPRDLDARLSAYLRTLGMKNPMLIKTLSHDCLQRAGARAAPAGAKAELFRRTLEEAQRRFDRALAHALGLRGAKDPHALAAARAACLLGAEALDGDRLMAGDAEESGAIDALLPVLPLATPPEARLPMEEQPISFFFSKSPHPRT